MGGGVSLLIAALLCLHFGGRWATERHREQTLNQMQTRYALTPAQLAAIREIEIGYHGLGGLSSRPADAMGEAAHRTTISQQMSAETAARFLAED
jgi:hypothetical protein